MLRRCVSLAGRGGRGAGGGAGEAADSDPRPTAPGPAWPERGGGFCPLQAAVSALVVVSEQEKEFRSVLALSERCEAGGGVRRPSPRLGGSGWRAGS